MTSSDYLSPNTQLRPPLPHLNISNTSNHATCQPGTTSSSSSAATTPNSTSPSAFMTPSWVPRPSIQPMGQPHFIYQSTNRIQHPPLRYAQPPMQIPPVLSRTNTPIPVPQSEPEILDDGFLKIFNMNPKNDQTNQNAEPTTNTTNGDHPDLINIDEDPSFLKSPDVVDLFDPIKPLAVLRVLDTSSIPRPHSWPTNLDSAGTAPKSITPTFSTPNSELSPSSPHPFPIRLHFSLTAFPEIQVLSELVQQIRSEPRSQQIPTDEIFYCERVKRLTPQHLEQKQIPVALHIFVNGAKEPLRLVNISLQSTVAHILYQLLELTSFDFDTSILKLRSREEYLRNEDVLCDIEYVYNCLQTLQQLQFVLVQKPSYVQQQQQQQQMTNINFEQFCLSQQEEAYQTLPSLVNTGNGFATVKQLKSINRKESLRKVSSLYSNRHATMSHQAHLARSSNAPFLASDPRWLNEFRTDITVILEQIEQRVNRLVICFSSKEQIKSINELLGFIKKVEVTCSYIESSLIVDKQRELRMFVDELTKKSLQIDGEQKSTFQHDELVRLLLDFVVKLVNYLRTYCQAFLIPYTIELFDRSQQPIDIEQKLNQEKPTNRSINESPESFRVYIDGLFCLSGPAAANIKSVRILARLCYGNRTKARLLTSPMSIVRNSTTNDFHQNVPLKPQVRFDQWLSFDDARLCELQRESLLLFEIYANFVDESDNSSAIMIEDTPMHLIGWCSQALFDSEHRLLTGERYLGIFDSSTMIRSGFYSLRNVFERDCPILSVSFLLESYSWPHVQARNDFHAGNFTEMSQEKQEQLCRLLKRPTLLLADHSLMMPGEVNTENRKTIFLEEERDFSEDECQFLWSHRHFVLHKPYVLSKLFNSRTVWDYPSLIDIYGLLNEVARDRTIDEIEAFELLLPAFPDMHVRSFAYNALISRLSSHDLILYLPQLLQIIKFDYSLLSPIVRHLLHQSLLDHRLAHKLYWHLRQLLVDERLHYIRYYYLFMALVYIIEPRFRTELNREYELCQAIKTIGTNLKQTKSSTINKTNWLHDQLKMFDSGFFHNNQQTCRLPCQFNFMTNGLDIPSCSFFKSLTLPLKLVFNPIDSACDKYYSLFKIGDDLRQDQTVLQLFSCMDKIWQANDFDFRLSLFNIVQTQERCGFIEMITESETLREIESRAGPLKGSFCETALYDWLRSHNTTEREFQKALDNLTYSCAAYCVATYILGIGDRHNDNIMVKQSGHLFHIDFGKYLGDAQKFGSFNRDRAPFVFTKQMLYAINGSDTSGTAFHRFVDLCCNAFCTIRQNSTFLLLLLSHLCSSNVPNLNHDAVRFVYQRLFPALNDATSITRFTTLIVESLNSTWTQINFAIHALAQTTASGGSTATMPAGATLSFVPRTYTIATDGKVKFGQVVSYEKRTRPSKHYVYKLKIERETMDISTMINPPSRRLQTTYHYRTYAEFYEFCERLNKQFPLIGIGVKFSHRTENKFVAQARVSDINEFLGNLFRLTSEIVESDLVCTFFHMIQRDQQMKDAIEKSTDDLSTRSSYELSISNQAKIRIILNHDDDKLYVNVRYANNLPLRGGNEPNPYCKCYLFPDPNKSSKKKGRIVLNSRNPTFNDMFVYEMGLAEIQKRVLRVSVWNSGLMPGIDVLGEVDIVLAKIDWSKENARDYIFSSPEAWLDT